MVLWYCSHGVTIQGRTDAAEEGAVPWSLSDSKTASIPKNLSLQSLLSVRMELQQSQAENCHDDCIRSSERLECIHLGQVPGSSSSIRVKALANDFCRVFYEQGSYLSLWPLADEASSPKKLALKGTMLNSPRGAQSKGKTTPPWHALCACSTAKVRGDFNQPEKYESRLRRSISRNASLSIAHLAMFQEVFSMSMPTMPLLWLTQPDSAQFRRPFCFSVCFTVRRRFAKLAGLTPCRSLGQDRAPKVMGAIPEKLR